VIVVVPESETVAVELWQFAAFLPTYASRPSGLACDTTNSSVLDSLLRGR